MASAPEAPLVVQVGETDVGLEVIAIGELDLSTVDLFRSALTDAVNGPGNKIQVNLAGVTFIDSTGLRALMERWTGATGHRWSLSGLSGSVRRIIEMTGVADVFDLDSGDAATALEAARAEYDDAIARNRAAVRAGQHPPVGTGALLVLDRRVSAAELRLRREADPPPDSTAP